MLVITPTISIDESELQESFIRASGAGGQNIQKVATAVQLKFDARSSAHLPEFAYLVLVQLAGRRLGKDGVLTITAQRFRTQERNRADARERLILLLQEAVRPPPPRRRATRPSRASIARQRMSKIIRARTKQQRRDPRAEPPG